MAKSEHYALRFDDMESAIKEFLKDRQDLSYTFEEANKSSYAIKIWKEKKDGSKEKKPGIIKVYNRMGRYCLVVEGNPSLKTVSEECRQFLIDNLRIPDMDAKCYVQRDVDTELYEVFLDILREDFELSNDVGNVEHAFHHIVTDNHSASVHLTLFDNGTLMIQGIFTALFSNLIACAAKELAGDDGSAIKELLSLSQMKNEHFKNDIHQLVAKSKPLIDYHLDTFVMSSIILANSNIEVEDYGCHTFGILKAIEGLLALKLSTQLFSDNDSIGKSFEENSVSHVFHLKPTIHEFDSKVELKKYIEKAYNTYNKNRNTTFHVKKMNVETSRVLSYEDAVGIIEDGLEIINGICNNW